MTSQQTSLHFVWYHLKSKFCIHYCPKIFNRQGKKIQAMYVLQWKWCVKSAPARWELGKLVVVPHWAWAEAICYETDSQHVYQMKWISAEEKTKNDDIQKHFTFFKIQNFWKLDIVKNIKNSFYSFVTQNCRRIYYIWFLDQCVSAQGGTASPKLAGREMPQTLSFDLVET